MPDESRPSRRTLGNPVDYARQLVGRERLRSDPAHGALSIRDDRRGELRQAQSTRKHASGVVHHGKREPVAFHHAFGARRVLGYLAPYLGVPRMVAAMRLAGEAFRERGLNPDGGS